IDIVRGLPAGVALSAVSTKRTCSVPQRTTSAWLSACFCTRTSLTKVPLDEPRSSTIQRPPENEILQFLRDTMASSVRTAQSAPRPRNAPSGMMSTDASRPLPSRYKSFPPTICLLDPEYDLGRTDADHVADL